MYRVQLVKQGKMMGKTLLEKYEEKSQDPARQRYSPLQCAIDDGQMVDVQTLIRELRGQGSHRLKEALLYRNGNFGETILHIAMKYPRIFELCCDALKQIQLFEPTLLAQDADKDTIMHQIVEFGRVETLNVLMNDDEAQPLLSDLIQKKNKHGETAEDILKNFEHSETIIDLKARGILDEEKLINTQNNLQELSGLFQKIQHPAMSCGMR